MNLDMKLKFNFNKRNKYKISKCGNYAYANINNKNVALHRHGLLCNIVVLKVIKDEEK